jgi:hypothetical protein
MNQSTKVGQVLASVQQQNELDAEIVETAVLFAQIKDAKGRAMQTRDSYKCEEAYAADSETGDPGLAPCRLREALEHADWCDKCQMHEQFSDEVRSLKIDERTQLMRLRRLCRKRPGYDASQAQN